MNKKKTVLFDSGCNLEENVTNMIQKIGIPANFNGYQYLRAAIIMSVENLGLSRAVTKEIYPTIARQNKTKPSGVERGIRYALQVAWDRGELRRICKSLGYAKHNMKMRPANGEFISLVADRIRLDTSTG